LKLIETTQSGRILEIHLNRPEKRNALNVKMCHEIVDAIERADEDEATGAIVLAGNGPAFCAGMDLKESVEAEHSELAAIHERLFTLIQRVRTPIVAAVHGAALAGGTGLTANAHIVYSSADARFGLTEIRMGLWPVLIFRAVEHALGERKTVELALTGRQFGAQEALDFGLVTEIADDPLAKARSVAETMAGYSPLAISIGLDYVHRVRGRDWDHAGRIGRELRNKLLTGADYHEGVAAFLEKRNPNWPSLKQ
jgi:enoyl-CoA hydratase/carnithine racemase